MTKEELFCKLHALGIDRKLVHFSSGVEEGYYIRKCPLCWEAFYQERGKEYDPVGFPCESDALDHVYDQITRYLT